MLFFSLIITINAWASSGQPTPDTTCPITEIGHTEYSDSTGQSFIGVRNYGCNDNNVNVVWSVSIPQVCENGGCGLIIDIHGATMDAQAENLGSKLREYGWKAEEYGAITPYIVMQPNLTDLFDEQSGLDIESVIGGAYLNELPSMEVFIDDAINKFSIDENRIHMYGFSRGTHTTNEFYCNEDRREKYASFGMHGEKLKCNVNEKPLIITNGIFDFFTPNQQWRVNSTIIEQLRSEGFTETVLHRDDDWRTPSWDILKWQEIGKHEHLRFIKDNRWLESIQHSGKTYPLLGHCHPILEKDAWLRCHTNFDIGEKIIQFFIAHPKS